MVDRFKNTEDAEKFIVDLLKDDKSLSDDKEKQRAITINHVPLANAFTKLIATAPISSICKKVMIVKIMNPGITEIRVAIILGIKTKDVKRYEQEGLHICKELLKRVDLQGATNKYNAEEQIQREVNRLKGKQSNP